jgi:hypothetical protein
MSPLLKPQSSSFAAVFILFFLFPPRVSVVNFIVWILLALLKVICSSVSTDFEVVIFKVALANILFRTSLST